LKYLEGKFALITGGGRGIGRAVALEFAKNGANIAVMALEKNEVDQTAEEIKNYGVKSISIPVDLSNIDGVKECVYQYFKSFKRCDILVNNAGISHHSTVVEYPLEKAVKLFNLNLIAPYALTKLILPKMIEQGSGNIIMSSSVQGTMFFNPKKVAYSTTKAGIAVMGKCMQAELTPHDIRVNVIMPGAIDTKIVQENMALGQINPEPISPMKISPIFLFLASDISKRRYKGRYIKEMLIRELLPIIRAEIKGNDWDMKELTRNVKSKLTKGLYKILVKDRELIEFLLKYNN